MITIDAMARWAGRLSMVAIVALLFAGCGAPDAADADATFFAQQTAVAGSRPSPTSSPTVEPTEQTAPSPTLAVDSAATETTATETPAEATATLDSGAATTTAIAESLPAEVSGSGTDVSDTLTLAAGLHLAQLSHTGTAGFVVTLLDSNGVSVVELADGSGAWVGSRGFVIPETGEYVAEVSADGDWSIEIDTRSPTDSIVAELPFEQAGSGSQAVYFVRVTPGEHTLSVTHDGAAGFAATVLSSDGAYTDEVFLTTGIVDQSEVFTVPEPAETTEGTGDVFLMIDIRASGSWTIRVE
jgi:hypothetical protein